MQLVSKESYMKLSNKSVAWLKTRGISKKTAETLNLQTSNTYIRSVEKETECVVFPYINKGTNYASKIRSISEKGFSCSGSPQSFYNIDNVQPDGDMIICEGEMDVASFVEAGWTSVVSVPNGAVMKVVDNDINPEEDNKFRFLWDAKDELDDVQ